MAIHFVGFRGDEYTRACRIFGKPDFIHRNWDERARFGGEYDFEHDTFVFAKGSEFDIPSPYSFNDSGVM